MKKKLFLYLILFLSIEQKIVFSLSSDEKSVFADASHHEKNNNFLKLVKNAQLCTNSLEVMKIGLDQVRLKGFFLEMGVFSGKTINFIATDKLDQIIYGFDSFQGLPEAWSRDDTTMFAKGFFAINKLPNVLSNVVLVPGWFENSLPVFKQAELKNQFIAFMHIDCDLYSSTKTIFDILGDNIIPGTILVFDELYNYPGFDRHEIKALYEYLERKNYKVEYLAYNASHEQVALKIIE